MSLHPGSRLGAYEILGALGSGGMGEVYRARDSRLGREVALKVLPEAFAADPERLARFEREAKAVAALNHPNIVTLYSIEEAGPVRFLTMELVEGQTLDQAVVPGGMPLPRVLDLGIALAEALVAAHERGVVHRDLKPANVMWTRDGRVKVLDFGLAKATATGAELDATQAATLGTPISGLGRVVGTVPYMSPEQVRGERVDSRTDLFSLGIVLYELATGQRPFGGSTSADLSSAILRDPPAPLSQLRSGLPPELDRIIARCLEKDPEQRIQTAKDVRNELERLRRDVGSGSGPLSGPGPGSRSGHGPRPPSDSGTGPAPVAPRDIASIAVLPFVNRSRDEEDEYFADGLADELLSVLAKIRGLRVAARTSSFQFKGTREDLSTIGEKLNVATLLEGSVRKSGNRVRIAVQLVKVADGYQLWSETYDRTLEDIFAVQDDIAQAVVKELRTALLGETADSEASGDAKAAVAAAARGRSANPEVHRLYLQGKHLIDRVNEADTQRGVTYLQEALTLEPDLALAWVQLAQAYGMQGGYGWAPVLEAFRKSREAVERALALDPDLAGAHVMRSRNARFHEWDWKVARAASRRALELAPDSPEALTEAAQLEQNHCRFEAAERYLRRAVDLDPLASSRYAQLGMLYRCMDKWPEAERACRKALELAPQRVSTHQILAIIYADTNRDTEALAEAALEPARWAQLTALGYVHFRGGRRHESDRALEELKRISSLESGYQIAAIHSLRGEVDEGFAWLDRSYEQKDAGIPHVYSEPSFRPLHGDPRWPAFLRKLGYLD